MTTSSTPARSPVTALVLAGGAASRMGGHKAERLLGSRSLLERSLSLADVVADEVLLLPGARSFTEAAGRRVVRDWPAAQPLGPLAALGAGLEAARHPWCLLLPCDMPWLSADVALRLIERAARTEQDIVAVRSATGWQPFLALYRSALASRVRAELAAGRRSLVGLLERSATLAIAPDELADLDAELRCLHNVNTPEELAAAVLAEAV